MSRRRFDERSFKRRGPTRQPKKRILIVCEGKVTEREYFKAYRSAVRNPSVEVRLAEDTGVPLTVVQIALRLKREAEQDARRQEDDNLLWDEVWCVHDVDEHPNLHQARELAEAHGIELAISNPCFELWALLHFQEQRAHIERKRARAALQRHLPGYDKALDYGAMHPGYASAVRRAKSLTQDAAELGEPGRNPTTGVYRLTESIREGGLP